MIPRRRFARNSARPHAFTLLEIILAMSVMAILSAILLPPMALLLSDRRLQRSGDLLEIEIAKTRLDAMRDGRVLMLGGQAGENRMSVAALYGGQDATESNVMAGPSALATGAASASIVPIAADADAGREIDLPEGITLTGMQVIRSARSVMVSSDPTAIASTSPDALPPTAESVYFYPDGSTSDALIRLSGEDGETIGIIIRGVTGQTRRIDMVTE